MSKKLVLYVSYGAKKCNIGVTGNCSVDVSLLGWLFPIITHNSIIKELEQKGLKSINIISVLRSYK